MVALQIDAITEVSVELEERLERAENDRDCGGLEPQAIALYRCLIAFDTYQGAGRGSRASRRLMDAFLSQPEPILSDEQAVQVDLHLAGVLDLCASCLADAVKVGALSPGDAKQRSTLVLASLHGLSHFRKRDRIQPDQLSAAALGRGLFEALFLGFGALPKHLGPAMERLGG